MSKQMAIVVAVAGISGCAGISVTPLTTTGAPDTTQQEGFRYYVPKPYLLVVEIPTASADGADSLQNQIRPAPTNPAPAAGTVGAPPTIGGGAPLVIGENNPQPVRPGQPPRHAGQPPAGSHAAGAAAPASDTTGKGGAPSATSDTNTTTTGDTSFYAANTIYVIKLIYLPDYSHPMAVGVHSGLIGTSSIQLGFQNGWMLTSLNGSSDNKVAETLASVASLIGAVKGVGGGGGGGGTTGGGGGHAAGGAYVPQAMLLPGLYAFDNRSNGLLGLCIAQPFGPTTDGQHYGQIPLCTGTQGLGASDNGGVQK